MSLTIQGAHGNNVWIEAWGDLHSLSANDLAAMRDTVRMEGVARRWGREFDESDVTALIQALTGPQLDDCADCEGPALVNIEGRLVCPGHANGYGIAEQESEGER